MGRRALGLGRSTTAHPLIRRVQATLPTHFSVAPPAPAAHISVSPAVAAPPAALVGARSMVAAAGVGTEVSELFCGADDDETLQRCKGSQTGPPRPPTLRSVPAAMASPGSHARFMSTRAGAGTGARTASSSARVAAAAAPEDDDGEDSDAAAVPLDSDEGEASAEEEEGDDGGDYSKHGTPLEEVAELSAPMRRRLTAAGITSLFPVQARSLAGALARRDVIVRSRTGSGKTMGFAIPIVQALADGGVAGVPPAAGARGRPPRAIILAPTRELARQVEQEIARLTAGTRIVSLAVYGGAAMGPQEGALRNGVDIIVGTPGESRVTSCMHSALTLAVCCVAACSCAAGFAGAD